MDTEKKRRRGRTAGTDGFAERTAVWIRLPIGEIHISPSDEKRSAGSIAELAASIARHGLLQPVVVRKMEGSYRIVLGVRRLEACRLLGMKEIDAILIDADDAESAACCLEEDEVRRALPAWMRCEFVERIGQEALGPAYALNDGMLRRLYALSGLSANAKSIIRHAALSLEQSEPLLWIRDSERQTEAASIIAERGLTAEQAMRLVRGPSNTTLNRDSGTGRRRAIRNVVQEVSSLVKRLQIQGIDACVSVHSQDKGMCIQIRITKP